MTKEEYNKLAKELDQDDLQKVGAILNVLAIKTTRIAHAQRLLDFCGHSLTMQNVTGNVKIEKNI